MTGTKPNHTPVLEKEILALLLFENVESVFDGTLGLGGHAESILKKFPKVKQYIACDLDSQHIAFARKRLTKWKNKVVFHHANFSELKIILNENNPPHPLIILLDLGLCSHHVDNPEKGFSFQQDSPLTMSFDTNNRKNAAQIINNASEQELMVILKNFGEEPHAKKLSQAISKARKNKPLETTFDLRKVIEDHTHPKDRNKTLMRVFQAFRIAVNDELKSLKHALTSALEIMKKGDRMGVISYHALEDRIVKNFVQTHSKPKTIATAKSLHTPISLATIQKINRKPITPSTEEVQINPRARSAKLRIFEKTT